MKISTIRKIISATGKYIVMIFLLAYMVLPLLWIFSSALRPVPEIFKYVHPLSWKTFIPQEITFDNISDLLFSENSLWPRYIFNTIFIGVVTTIFGTIINALAAYAFARLYLPGKQYLFFIILLTVIIPFEAIALPLYLVINNLGWIDSYQALIIPLLANAFNIFLLRQFFLGIPKELEEAALIDGANQLHVFTRIVVPLSWPALISSGLITLQQSWDMFIWPLIVTNTPKVRVIQIGISNLSGKDVTHWNEIFAAVAISALIPILIFLFFQKYYIENSATSGIKG